MTEAIFTLAQASDTPGSVKPEASAGAGAAGQNTTMIGMPNVPAPTNGGTPTAAQQAVPTTAPAPTGGANTPPSFMLPLLIVGMFAILVIPTFFSQRKEKKKREELMNAMRKGDKVLTLGGLIGHVVDIDGVEVVLRVEDGRIRVAKSAIQQVLDSKSGPSASVEAKEKAGKGELAGSSN